MVDTAELWQVERGDLVVTLAERDRPDHSVPKSEVVRPDRKLHASRSRTAVAMLGKKGGEVLVS